MSESSKVVTKTLRQRFCEYYGCPDDTFPYVALKTFLYRPWSWLTPVLIKFFPKLLTTDIKIANQLGRVISRDGILSEVRDLRADYLRNGDFGLVRRVLRLRLSGARILQSTRKLWSSI